jgi:alpha-ribazole phosphatase
MKSYICFIRHGITEGNLKKWFYGSVDMPLVEEGIGEIKRFREEGIYPLAKNADFYTSGMLRTEQTIELIYGKIEHEVIPELKEMNFGEYECMTYDDLKDNDAFNRFAYNHDIDYVFPNGDSKKSFAMRVYKGLERLIGKHLTRQRDNVVKDTVSIVVCHGGVITASLSKLFPNEEMNMWDWMPKPGRGYKVYFEDDKPIRYEKF